MADVQYFSSIDLKSKFRLSQALANQKGICIYISIYQNKLLQAIMQAVYIRDLL